ncbi:MAG: DUF92 domain-containing protein [Candidatus Omnitrophica bacterium]|nr:DUF92 domain-containing protein [Candidatus Omnitrophota bacterium]
MSAWVAGILANLAIAALATRARALDRSGVLAAFGVGLLVWIGLGIKAFGLLVLFLAAGSLLTRLGFEQKAQQGIAQSVTGARSAKEVLAKGWVPAVCAAWALGVPATEGLASLAMVASLAAALSDTSSTEVGKVWGENPFRLFPWGPVSPGTPGAVSAQGLGAGLLGAVFVALAGTALGLQSPSLVGWIAAVGFLANLAESVLCSVLSIKKVPPGWVLNVFTSSFAACCSIIIGLKLGG